MKKAPFKRKDDYTDTNEWKDDYTDTNRWTIPVWFLITLVVFAGVGLASLITKNSLDTDNRNVITDSGENSLPLMVEQHQTEIATVVVATPTYWASPQATATPQPSATPAPSITPVNTATPQPSATPIDFNALSLTIRAPVDDQIVEVTRQLNFFAAIVIVLFVVIGLGMISMIFVVLFTSNRRDDKLMVSLMPYLVNGPQPMAGLPAPSLPRQKHGRFSIQRLLALSVVPTKPHHSPTPASNTGSNDKKRTPLLLRRNDNSSVRYVDGTGSEPVITSSKPVQTSSELVQTSSAQLVDFDGIQLPIKPARVPDGKEIDYMRAYYVNCGYSLSATTRAFYGGKNDRWFRWVKETVGDLIPD